MDRSRWPEQFLDVPQIGLVLHQMRGATVPPDVAGDVFAQPGHAGVFFHQFAQRVFAQRRCPLRDEHAVGAAALQQRGPDGFQIRFQKRTRQPGERHHAVFVELAAVDAQHAFLKVHVVDGQVHQLAFADAGGVERFQNRPVTIAKQTAGVRRLNDFARLLRREDGSGQRVRRAGQRQRPGHVLRDIAFDFQEPEEAPQRVHGLVLVTDGTGRAPAGGQIKQVALMVGQRAAGDGRNLGDVLLAQKFGEAPQMQHAPDDGSRREVEDFQLLPVTLNQDFDLGRFHGFL